MTIIGYLFGLPQQYFDSSVVPGEAAPEDATPQASRQLPAAISAPSPASRSLWNESGATCLTCGIGVTCPGFASPQEQRQHFKTDWHRYNVKRRLAKQPAVSEEAFERVLEQGTEVSISGSGTESSEADEVEEEEEGAAGVDVAGTAGQRRRKDGHTQVAATIPRVTFQASDGSHFSVWRCLLRQDHVKAPAGQPTSPSELLGELRRLRTGTGCWLVVLLRGGHFAATVFKPHATGNPAKQPDGGANSGLEGFDVAAHKTFHRYVVRAKAGGKQSSKDATGKFARSAGSRLRRYNEAALERDVQELLTSWTAHIAAADLLFVHAPASNARSLFSEGQTALLTSDPRMRRVPFVTHRPTHSETKRVLRLLCAVFRPEAAEQLLAEQGRAHVEEEAEAAAEALAAAQLSDDTSNNRRDGPGAHHQSQQSAAAPPDEAGMTAASITGAGAGLSAAASSAGPSQPPPADAAAEPPPSPPQAPSAGAEAPLHRAAKAGDPGRVRRLLEAGHDPAARDGKGRTPYALAADKATRDSFRRFMAQWPDRWDYAAAGIPSPLTEEMEAAQLSSKAARKAKLKAKEAERKASKQGGESGTEDRRRAAEAEAEVAAAARKQAVDDEIAQAAAEAAAMAARLHASSKPTSSSNRIAGGGKASGKVGGGAAGGSGGGKGASSAGSKGNQNAQPAVAAPSAAELARRREMMAAAAEARMRALTQASQQQKLW